MNHCIMGSAVAVLHHSSLLPIYVPLPRDKMFTLARQNQFTRLSHSRFSKRLFTFCLFVLKVWHHENYYCSSMTANKHCSSLQGSRLPPTDEYYHTVRLWGHQIWKTNKITLHYIACCHIQTHQELSWWPASITSQSWMQRRCWETCCEG